MLEPRANARSPFLRLAVTGGFLLAAASAPPTHARAVPGPSAPSARERPGVESSERPGQGAGERLAITHVNVVPMDREVVLEDMTVLVADGRIAGVMPAAEYTPPGDVRVIDGTGLYLAPGLMDMHSHDDRPIGMDDYLRWGITLVRVMGGSDDVLAEAAAIERGELAGPKIVSAAPPLQPAEFEGTWQATDAASARAGVREFAGKGYEWIKVIRLSDEALAATVQEARAHGMKVGGHLRFEQTLESFVAAGVDSVEHVEEAQWAAFGSAIPTDGELRDLARRLRDADSTVSSLLDSGILGSDMRVLGEAALDTERARALAAWLGPEQANELLPPIARSLGEQVGVGREANIIDLDNVSRFLRVLVEEGVNVVAGTDGNTTIAVPGRSLHAELELFVGAGLSPYQAMRTATVNAARLIDRQDELGTVDVGKTASLVLVRGNPLQDITVLRTPAGVLVGGRYFEMGPAETDSGDR